MSTTTPLSAPVSPVGRARRRTRSREPVAYDFRRPIQLSREHQRRLQVAFDAFARQAGTIFTSALRTICQVSVESIDQRSYAEYVDGLDATTYFTVFTVEPVAGLAMMEMPLRAVMACVDHMLGGPGGADQPERALTEIESGVVSGLVQRLMDGLRYGFAETVAWDPVVVGVEYNPQFAQVAASSEVMVVTTIELRIAEAPHTLTFCLPFNSLHPHLVAAAGPAPVSDRERSQRAYAAELVRRQFQQVPVDVAVRLRGARVSTRVFDNLECGDVIGLGHPASAPLDVVVEDTVFAHASVGARGPKLAALIVDTPQETP